MPPNSSLDRPPRCAPSTRCRVIVDRRGAGRFVRRTLARGAGAGTRPHPGGGFRSARGRRHGEPPRGLCAGSSDQHYRGHWRVAGNGWYPRYGRPCPFDGRSQLHRQGTLRRRQRQHADHARFEQRVAGLPRRTRDIGHPAGRYVRRRYAAVLQHAPAGPRSSGGAAGAPGHALRFGLARRHDPFRDECARPAAASTPRRRWA